MYRYVIRCDFGNSNRKEILSRHETKKSALNRYSKLWNVYHAIHGYKIWLDKICTKEGLKILNRNDFYNYNLYRKLI